MTMLDRMRRHMSWLKWSLGLVCLAFIIFYIPDFLRGSGADAASGDTIAKVDGQEISTGEFPIGTKKNMPQKPARMSVSGVMFFLKSITETVPLSFRAVLY